MDAAEKKKIKGWCTKMAEAKELYINTCQECAEIVHEAKRELFFTSVFFPVLVDVYKPKIIHFDPVWGDPKFSTGEEWFEVELCGEKYKIFALWDKQEVR